MSHALHVDEDFCFLFNSVQCALRTEQEAFFTYKVRKKCCRTRYLRINAGKWKNWFFHTCLSSMFICMTTIEEESARVERANHHTTTPHSLFDQFPIHTVTQLHACNSLLLLCNKRIGFFSNADCSSSSRAHAGSRWDLPYYLHIHMFRNCSITIRENLLQHHHQANKNWRRKIAGSRRRMVLLFIGFLSSCYFPSKCCKLRRVYLQTIGWFHVVNLIWNYLFFKLKLCMNAVWVCSLSPAVFPKYIPKKQELISYPNNTISTMWQM